MKNLEMYKSNEKKNLYQNIRQNLINHKILKETHKKNKSCYNDNLFSSSKAKGALTSKDAGDSLEKINVGALSEENRKKYPKFNNKKLTELMKSYELDDNQLKTISTKFKTTRYFCNKNY